MKLTPVWRRICQNKFFSSIYVLGSALSVASAMLIVIFVYVKVADIYPEHDRNHIIKFSEVNERTGNGAMSAPGFSLDYANELAEAFDSVATAVSLEFNSWLPAVVDAGNGRLPFKVRARYVDPNFFRVYDYEIMAGNSISNEDFGSGVACCIISDKLAENIFGSVESAPGRMVKVGTTDIAVRGVFREPSYLQQNSFAQIMFPSSMMSHMFGRGNKVAGNFAVLARVDTDEAADSLQVILAETLERFGRKRTLEENSGREVTVDIGTSDSLTQIAFGMDEGFSWSQLMLKYGFIILILLIVPALNLGGLIAGNMEMRLPEMGVRKSFGANRGRLLGSVLAENMVLTSMGGILGLIISWLLVVKWRNWMFYMDDSIMYDAPVGVTTAITGEMIFAPAVFATAFLLCCFINVMAAMIPAWWSLRKPIVESLSENK